MAVTPDRRTPGGRPPGHEPTTLVPRRRASVEVRMESWRVPVEARNEELFSPPIQGRIETFRHQSQVLQGNPWGDPPERDLPVYLPPSGETSGRPLLVLLSGYAGSGWLHYQRPRFLEESLVARLDRLIRNGAAAEAVMIAPDCMTTLGGSQYLNSRATGRYEDYVVQEIVPWIQERYHTGPTAVFGTSSGGYGALVLGLRHPELFPVVGSDAGDAYFEYCYPPDFPVTLREIRRAGGSEALLRQIFRGPVGPVTPANPLMRALSTFAYSSAYSPIDSQPGRFDLPFDLDTGELRPEVWSHWLEQDPVRMVQTPKYSEAARRLSLLFLLGGLRDEFGLDVSARILAAAARRQEVKVELEILDGGHFDKGPRYERMIPRLISALGFPPPKPGPSRL